MTRTKVLNILSLIILILILLPSCSKKINEQKAFEIIKKANFPVGFKATDFHRLNGYELFKIKEFKQNEISAQAKCYAKYKTPSGEEKYAILGFTFIKAEDGWQVIKEVQLIKRNLPSPFSSQS